MGISQYMMASSKIIIFFGNEKTPMSQCTPCPTVPRVLVCPVSQCSVPRFPIKIGYS